MPNRTLRFESLEPRLTYDASPAPLELPADVRTLVAEALTMSAPETGWHAPSPEEATNTELSSSARLLSLRGTDGMVRGVRGTAAAGAPAVTMTAHVFRGNDEIASIPLGPDGGFSYETDDGITDVVITPSSKTTIAVTNVETSAMAHMPDASNDPLSVFSSRAFGLAAAPVVPMPSNVAAAVKSLNLTGSPNGSGEKRFYAERDPGAFTLFRIEYTKGSGRIASVGTIMKTAVDYMGREAVTTSGFPQGYMLQIDANAVIIAPGAPRLISFVGGFSNAAGRLTMAEGASLEAVMPPAAMTPDTVDSTMLKMNAQFQEEGIFPGVTEIRESSSPVFSSPGHQANVWYQVKNDALGGGSIGFDVYAGWYAGEPTRGTLQRRFDTSLAGGQTIKLSVNVTAPARPADATSDRPIISLVTRFQSGATEVANKLGKEPLSRDVRVVTNDENGHPVIHFESQTYTAAEQARIRDLTDRALNALLTSGDLRLSTIKTALGGNDHLVELLARDAAVAMADAAQAPPSTQMNDALNGLAQEWEPSVNDAYVNTLDNPANRVVLLSMTIASNQKVLQDFGTQTTVHGEWPTEGLSTKIVKFQLTGDSMLNLSLADTRGWLTLYKDGVKLFSPERQGFDGKTISARVPAGSYEVRVTPDTLVSQELVPVPRTPKLTVDVEPFDRKIIRGKISRDGDSDVMNIKLQKIKMDGTVIDDNPQNIDVINPAVTTWIYIHGREDSYNTVGNMRNLAGSLYETGDQVLALDWSEAASDNDAGPLLDVDWVKTVAQWATSQLQSLGISGSNLRVVAHSHGTFVAYEMGKRLRDGNGGSEHGNGFGVDRLIALDSAKDFWITNNYPATEIDFASVSNSSLALRSSAFGSAGRSNTADYNFELITPNEITQHEVVNDIVSSTRSSIVQLPAAAYALSAKWATDNAEALFYEHGFAVSAFISALRNKGDVKFQGILDDFLDGRLPAGITIDPNRPEGMILLESERDEQGWLYAIPHTTL